MVTRYRMTLAYDGTRYAGWQIQPGRPTIQAEVERAIREITGESVKVHGSGRTDQGVHARGQEAHFDLAQPIEATSLLRGVNALLPEDIRVRKVVRVPASFHARRSAAGKEYRYFIFNGPVADPCSRLYEAHVRDRLDVEAMQKAAARLVGRHDFASFTANPNREVESTVREVQTVRVLRRGQRITVVVAGEGFLYRMVRSICGLLIRVGRGQVTIEEVEDILRARTRTARVPTAPARGLFLWRVWYEKHFEPLTKTPAGLQQRGV